MVRTTRRLLLLLGLAGAAACADGGLSESPASPADDPLELARAAAAADGEEVPSLDEVARYASNPGVKGVERARATIGPDGGSLRLRDFEVIVPAGAVDRDTKFEIMILPEPARDAHAWARFKPHNQQFAVPVVLRVPFATTESAGSEDAHVLWWNHSLWEELPTTVTEDGRLETTTDHFSVYATQRMRGITMVGG